MAVRQSRVPFSCLSGPIGLPCDIWFRVIVPGQPWLCKHATAGPLPSFCLAVCVFFSLASASSLCLSASKLSRSSSFLPFLLPALALHLIAPCRWCCLTLAHAATL